MLDKRALIARDCHRIEIEMLNLNMNRLLGEREKIIGQPIQHALQRAGETAYRHFAAAFDDTEVARARAFAGFRQGVQDVALFGVAHDLPLLLIAVDHYHKRIFTTGVEEVWKAGRQEARARF